MQGEEVLWEEVQWEEVQWEKVHWEEMLWEEVQRKGGLLYLPIPHPLYAYPPCSITKDAPFPLSPDPTPLTVMLSAYNNPIRCPQPCITKAS